MTCPRDGIKGLRVRLLRTLRTRGGDVFLKGRVMLIYDRWGGRFNLRTLRVSPMRQNKDGSESRKFGITKVSRFDFVEVG